MAVQSKKVLEVVFQWGGGGRAGSGVTSYSDGGDKSPSLLKVVVTVTTTF